MTRSNLRENHVCADQLVRGNDVNYYFPLLIEAAKDQWALEKKQRSGTIPTETDLAPYLKGNALPFPVVGETYNINPIGTPATATLPTNIAYGNVPKGGAVSLP